MLTSKKRAPTAVWSKFINFVLKRFILKFFKWLTQGFHEKRFVTNQDKVGNFFFDASRRIGAHLGLPDMS